VQETILPHPIVRFNPETPASGQTGPPKRIAGDHHQTGKSRPGQAVSKLIDAHGESTINSTMNQTTWATNQTVSDGGFGGRQQGKK